MRCIKKGCASNLDGRCLKGFFNPATLRETTNIARRYGTSRICWENKWKNERSDYELFASVTGRNRSKMRRKDKVDKFFENLAI